MKGGSGGLPRTNYLNTCSSLPTQKVNDSDFCSIYVNLANIINICRCSSDAKNFAPSLSPML